MKKLPIIVFILALLIPVIANAEEPRNGYRGYVEVALGDAYNFNTAQTISTNNMQLCSMISTIHGYALNYWYMGGGVGYYHSFRDEENMYPIFVVGRYTFTKVRFNPYFEPRCGIIYDPHWVRKVQAYGALCTGINVYKRLQVGLRLSMFSRPSRYFTANAAIVVSCSIGK